MMIIKNKTDLSKISKKTTKLKFDNFFDEPIDFLQPSACQENITNLILGWKFNQPINNLPISIIHL